MCHEVGPKSKTNKTIVTFPTSVKMPLEFYKDCIEFVNHLGEYKHVNNIKSSDR